MNKFEVTGMLGKGGFASVFSVKDRNGAIYALKKPFHDLKYLNPSTGVINMKELYVMAWVKHPYIQNATTVFFEDPCPNDNSFLPKEQGYDRMFFLMSKAEYTCHELVHLHKAPISHVKRAMFQVTCAISYLHSEGVCHRDLKPGNFLCYYNKGILTTRVTDFGMTKPINYVGRNSLHAGTAYYRAPELILGNMEYGFSMDVWSLGCAFYEMVSGRTLFKATDDISLLQLIFTNRGSPNEKTYSKLVRKDLKIIIGNHKPKTARGMLALKQNDRMLFDQTIVDHLYNPGTLDEFCDLLDKMLRIDPDERITMKQVMAHPFFAGHFIPHPQDFGLWRPEPKPELIPMQIFPDHHKHWQIGANCFIEMHHNTEKYDDELLYSVRFHGLDLYSRFLLKIDPIDDPRTYMKIAWCSGYITSKYFLDEASDHLWDLFPDSILDMKVEEIIKIERMILQILEFEIYRPTCFTYLKHRAFYAALFALMLRGNLMFNRSIKDMMEMFNSGVLNMLGDCPKISL